EPSTIELDRKARFSGRQHPHRSKAILSPWRTTLSKSHMFYLSPTFGLRLRATVLRVGQKSYGLPLLRQERNSILEKVQWGIPNFRESLAPVRRSRKPLIIWYPKKLHLGTAEAIARFRSV